MNDKISILKNYKEKKKFESLERTGIYITDSICDNFPDTNIVEIKDNSKMTKTLISQNEGSLK